ncbi:MAG: NAD-dependent epimerase/dehydratase family protein [Pseudomonadota bacterium]
MHVMITGANGFVGRHLAERLLAEGVNGHQLSALTLLDVCFNAAPFDKRVGQLAGSISDEALLRQAFATPVDVIFHLASVPGGAAERDFSLGLEVNLQATIALLECARRQAVAPRLIYASSIAVYGTNLPERIDDSTPMRPHLSYGAHKRASEILIEDYSRRGWGDGRIVRLPGIVARPPSPSGLLSAFMSDVFWSLAAGVRFLCPVSAAATSWWMSVGCCVDNLMHAAALMPEQVESRRDYTLPVLRFSMGALIDGLAARYGADRLALVDYEPVASLEAGFGAQPPLDASAAQAIGFRHDGSLEALIERICSEIDRQSIQSGKKT